MAATSLVGCGLRDEDVQGILCLAPDELVDLDLRGNELTDAGAGMLASALQDEGCRIRSLQLWGNRVGAEGATALASALSLNRTLLYLNLGSQQLAPEAPNELCGDSVAAQFATALRQNVTLTSLDLRYLGMSDIGARSLACALPCNTSLRHLDVRYNSIGGEGLCALAVSLGDVETPLRVWLKANAYDDKAAAALADLLESSPKLAKLAAGQERLWF